MKTQKQPLTHAGVIFSISAHNLIPGKFSLDLPDEHTLFLHWMQEGRPDLINICFSIQNPAQSAASPGLQSANLHCNQTKYSRSKYPLLNTTRCLPSTNNHRKYRALLLLVQRKPQLISESCHPQTRCAERA